MYLLVIECVSHGLMKKCVGAAMLVEKRKWDWEIWNIDAAKNELVRTRLGPLERLM